jgi:hypothetical protein
MCCVLVVDYTSSAAERERTSPIGKGDRVRQPRGSRRDDVDRLAEDVADLPGSSKQSGGQHVPATRQVPELENRRSGRRLAFQLDQAAAIEIRRVDDDLDGAVAGMGLDARPNPKGRGRKSHRWGDFYRQRLPRPKG